MVEPDPPVPEEAKPPPVAAPAPRAYRFAVALVRLLVRLFFREAAVTGLEHVPRSGGGVLVAWHPNAIIDGCLILAHFPHQASFGARHGLFAWPLLGALLRSLGVVPVYRRQDCPESGDEAARRMANEGSLDALAAVVAAGAYAALFPEGDSHDEPHPTELKTGAARLYYRARQLAPSGPPPAILPVGLHYDRKHLFRSSVLVSFHPPLELEAEIAEPPPSGASSEERRERYRRLTAQLEASLREVAHATESWELHHTMHRARKLLRAERANRAGVRLPRPEMKERVLGFSRVWAGYQAHERLHPEATRSLTERVQRYDRDLRSLGVEDHELDGVPRLASPWLAVNVASQALLVYLVLPPILLLGYVVNLPAAAFVWSASKLGSRKPKDEASLKLLLGAVAFPVTWLLVAALVTWGRTALPGLYPRLGSPLLTGAIALLLSAGSAWVALNYHRLASQTAHSIRVRLTRVRRRRALARLRQERADLHDAMARLALEVALPARVSDDGRVVDETAEPEALAPAR